MDAKKKNIFMGLIAVLGVAYIGWFFLMPEPSPVPTTSPAEPQSNRAESEPQQRQREPDRRQLALTAEQLSGEVSSRSPTSEEAREHAQLALSLRNQEMQTRRASLLAEMRRNEFEAMNYQRQFQALRDMDRDRFALTFSGGGDDDLLSTSREILQRESAQTRSSSPTQPPGGVSESASLSSYRLLGVFRLSSGEYAARVSRGGNSPERVLSGYIIDGDVEVTVLQDRVILTREDDERALYL